MNLKPKEVLTESEVRRGMNVVIWDGLASEMMTTFTGSAFLVAMALLMGANNVQIGILAALPTFTNIFQLISIWLVRKFNNRRAIAVFCAFLARFPLVCIGASALFFSGSSISILIFFLFFYYLFGSIAGPAWNSWMKDLIPESMLGGYFSRRSRYNQILDVVFSIVLAGLLDFVKSRFPEYELRVYAIFFIIAGIVGTIGGYVLSFAPEPQSYLSNANILSLFKQPLRDKNFRRLLTFNSAWVFALNIATPFFTVFMMKAMGLPISYIIILSIISQLSSIMTIRVWGTFADRYSNKTIIALSAPIYIVCILAWCFIGIYSNLYINLVLLAGIHMFTGISTAGINLSLTNIGLKLAPREDAIVYLSVKNIITAFFSSMGPLVGGILADYFASRSLLITAQWSSPGLTKVGKLFSLHQWNFLFLIGAMLALLSMELLAHVNEVGEVDKDVVKKVMRKSIKRDLKEYFLIGNIISWHEQLRTIIKLKKRNV
ncbi:MFS transporter [Chitinophaga filiformis]|uniref:Major Facilitator Superfamily protein n=1 Tax=Chitinophaga filiformis TaxID=104663 RepID=A0A1G8A7I4_CHIFI|nr:MFS transporter [Chitinophaga filiformis]SDH16888.1 Major Facilitator Superfamily protein [Chitinophaga filiformis]